MKISPLKDVAGSVHAVCDGRLHCDFSADGRMCEALDNAGVPRDAKWRTLVLYMRGMQEYSYLTDEQKMQVQQLLVDLLQNKDFSDRNYERILERDRQILVAPYEQRLNRAMQETMALAGEFRSILLRRKGDVEHLESRSIQAVTEGREPEEVVALLKDTFREVLLEMERDAAAMTELTQRDPLSGLHNRRAFDAFLSGAVQSWRREGTPLSLIMLDIDNFKNFNDEYGHRIGDQAIQTVARILQEAVRGHAAEHEKDFLVARYGGEEFSVVLRGALASLAEKIAESARSSMENFNFVIRNNSGEVVRSGISITLSAGVAFASSLWRGAYEDNLIDSADRALYEAKRGGRNLVFRYRDDQDGNSRYELVDS
ncbi:diguanylate cyclase [Oleidesulfovibrio alaskensis G20]|jgi:diguanylate cyclase (GGDEF)-like protein|uniref:diguanylate cyclase n=1 Tax=Oleidesulfovibrio alaskensis (strain ATCC BAA-1058 / DSM 17464 / G20) TaxID=207559 RepID=Q30ZP9_OLEA2|nr:GGDEF domain-containing protein [Oleidesulfovibrio alaskensis]ABB38847.1 diguanylate cyclase [Oleidesulfovibrio alaskensis G20]MBG0772362.1 GGDEF domain-containing protein [Oleidesulfovibrio alaskensis]